MASELQIEANRRNAQLSTGAKTTTGRRRSSVNALKHGLTSQQVTLFDEMPEDFEGFYHDILAALQPDGALETQLAERIAICGWRLRRAYRIERSLFQNARETWIDGETTLSSELHTSFHRLTENDDTLSKLSRYETGIERSFHRALFELEYQQSRRRGTAVENAALFDFRRAT